MAGKGTTFAQNLMLLYFNNTTHATIGDATGIVGSTTAGSLYAGLHTADPADAGSQTTSESAYTNYARVAVARSGAGWTVDTSGTAGRARNAAAINFPQCGATGSTITHFMVGAASSGTGQQGWSGALTASLAVSNGITPSFAINALTVTED